MYREYRKQEAIYNNNGGIDYEETFGESSENIPSGMRIWVSLINQYGKEVDWVNHIHHGILGAGNIRVVCHKQGRPEIYEATEEGFKKVEYCNIDTDWYDYDPIRFKYKGHEFYFESSKPYYAEMITPEGDKWECKYDYEYGAGF